MKITHIIWSFTVGGAETMLIDIVNQQASDGNNVNLVILNRHYSKELLREIDSRVKIVLLNRPVGSKNVLYVLQLNFLLLTSFCQIIHCHNYSLEKILFSYFLKKSILTIHGFNRPIKETNKYKMVVAISNAILKDLKSKGLRNIALVRNGVKTNLIEKKERFNFKIQIVCVGRLEHQVKGQDIILKALSLLKKDSIDSTLHFIGEGSSEDYLKRLSEQLKLKDDVIFHGPLPREKLYKLLKNFDIIVQPSIHEGFGLTAVEGMIAGIPLVISKASGLIEVTKDGELAYVVKDDEPNEYYFTLKKLILKIKSADSSIIRRKELSKSYASDNYSIKSTCDNYFNIYCKLLNLRP